MSSEKRLIVRSENGKLNVPLTNWLREDENLPDCDCIAVVGGPIKIAQFPQGDCFTAINRYVHYNLNNTFACITLVAEINGHSRTPQGLQERNTDLLRLRKAREVVRINWPQIHEIWIVAAYHRKDSFFLERLAY